MFCGIRCWDLRLISCNDIVLDQRRYLSNFAISALQDRMFDDHPLFLWWYYTTKTEAFLWVRILIDRVNHGGIALVIHKRHIHDGTSYPLNHCSSLFRLSPLFLCAELLDDGCCHMLHILRLLCIVSLYVPKPDNENRILLLVFSNLRPFL